MAELIFESASVQRLIEHAKCADQHDMGWASKAIPKPALRLVGDQGVYLMSNGKSADRPNDASPIFVAYARGLNPEIDPGWWETKRALYGGDDGADTLDVIDDIDLLLRRGEAEIRFMIDEDHISLAIPDVSWIKPDVLVRVRSGLGGIFNAIFLEQSDHDALVKRAENCGDFDDAKPYRVKLGQIFPADTQGVV